MKQTWQGCWNYQREFRTTVIDVLRALMDKARTAGQCKQGDEDLKKEPNISGDN